MSGRLERPTARRLPYLDEHLWQHILRNFTVSEWAWAAGTCKTTWDLQIDHICIDRKLSFEGWSFLLQRCREAKSFQLTKSVQDRAAFMHALSCSPHTFWMKSLLVLQALSCSPHTFWMKSLLVLQAIESELFRDSGLLTPPSTARSDARIDAVGALWRAAVDVKVAYIERPSWQRFSPTLPRLHHLIVGGHNIQWLCPTLRSFRTLQTLVLGGSTLEREAELDLAELCALEHLHIMNFAPQSISACRGCKLHLSWDEGVPLVASSSCFRKWLESKLWTSLSLPLASIRLKYTRWMSQEDMEALKQLTNQEVPLEYISLVVLMFGSDSEPIEIAKQQWQGLLTTSLLHISTVTACNLRLLSDRPSWTHLSLYSGDSIEMEADCMLGSLQALKHCMILCKSFRCNMLEQLGAAACHQGNSSHAIAAINYQNACLRKPHGPYSLCTVVGTDNMRQFLSVMACGCHACLPCLRRDGRVPEDIRLQHGPTHRLFSPSFLSGSEVNAFKEFTHRHADATHTEGAGSPSG